MTTNNQNNQKKPIETAEECPVFDKVAPTIAGSTFVFLGSLIIDKSAQLPTPLQPVPALVLLAGVAMCSFVAIDVSKDIGKMPVLQNSTLQMPVSEAFKKVGGEKAVQTAKKLSTSALNTVEKVGEVIAESYKKMRG